MRIWKLNLATVALAICGITFGASSADAQFGYGVPVYGPSPIVIAPPVTVAPPVIVAPPVVTSYRPIVPTYVAPAAVYSTYRPVYPVAPAPVYIPPVSVYVPPAYGTVTSYRAGFVGPGLGGIPSVYTPGQPVRNALRYVVP